MQRCRYSEPISVYWPAHSYACWDDGGQAVEAVIPVSGLSRNAADNIDYVDTDSVVTRPNLLLNKQRFDHTRKMINVLRAKVRARVARICNWPVCSCTRTNVSLIWRGYAAYWYCERCGTL